MIERHLTHQQYTEFVERALADPRGVTCAICRRRHRLRGTESAPRPKWSEAWEGWGWIPMQGVVYKSTRSAFLSIDEDGTLCVDNYNYDGSELLEFNDPESARVVADAIASVSGGWRDGEEDEEEDEA